MHINPSPLVDKGGLESWSFGAKQTDKLLQHKIWSRGIRVKRKKMVARKFQVLHNDSKFDVEYDLDDGFEVCPTFPSSLFLSVVLPSNVTSLLAAGFQISTLLPHLYSA